VKKEDRGPELVTQPGSSVPIPVGSETDIAQKANKCFETVVSQMYDGDELEFIGLTVLEAVVQSLAKDAPHDADARREFLDRVMGKPKQRVDSTAVTVDLTSFLYQLIKDEKQHEPPESGVIIDGKPSVSDAPEAEDELPFLC